MRPSEKTRRKSLFSSVQNRNETIELKPTTWAAVWHRFRTWGRPFATKRWTREEFETNKQTDNRFSQKYRTDGYQSAARYTKFCECDEWFPTVDRWTGTCQRNPYERTRHIGDRKLITETVRFYSVNGDFTWKIEKDLRENRGFPTTPLSLYYFRIYRFFSGEITVEKLNNTETATVSHYVKCLNNGELYVEK